MPRERATSQNPSFCGPYCPLRFRVGIAEEKRAREDQNSRKRIAVNSENEIKSSYVSLKFLDFDIYL